MIKERFSYLITCMSMIVVLTPLALSCRDKDKGNSIPESSDLIPVKIMLLSQTESTSVIATSGQLTTDDETTLSFKTGGIVQEVLVKEGDLIKKGQLLAKLNLTEINAIVAQVQLGYEKAQRDLERITILYKDSVATLEQFQNAQTGLLVAKGQREAANFNRVFSEIHASGNGYVLHKFVNAGQVVAMGTPILITNGAAPGKWILKVGVSDKQWAIIGLHDPADVHIDAFPDKPFTANVIRKSERADPQTGAFVIEMEVASDSRRLAAGMFASAEIKTGRKSSSWSVPYESVLDANGNSGFVFITNDNKTATRQPVTIESFNGNTIRINKGLESAQALIVSGSAYLADGSALEIIK